MRSRRCSQGTNSCPRTPCATTRALTIDAPIAAVWPWLAQIGEDRGGFYSYSVLERAVGAHIQNANTVHPEWQDVHVGDTVWLARHYGELQSRWWPRWRQERTWC